MEEFVTGKVIEEEKIFLQISTNAFSPDLKTRINKEISPIPQGLFNRLSKQELTDLLAYLVSGGEVTH